MKIALVTFISVFFVLSAFAALREGGASKAEGFSKKECYALGGIPITERNPRGVIACIKRDALILPNEPQAD
jgi:hypothetical protein